MKLLNCFLLVAAASSICLMVSCTGQKEQFYQLPPVDKTSATIKGSMIDPGTTSYNEFWAISEIDGKTVLRYVCGSLWPMKTTKCLEPIPLVPGQHTFVIKANTNGGRFFTETNATFIAEPSANYEVRGEFLENGTTSSWVVNTATNTIVTPKLSSQAGENVPIPVIVTVPRR